MKKGILAFIALIMMVSTVEANDGRKSNWKKGHYQREKTISFNERGVNFYIFPNGEFDFNTHNSYGSTYYDRNGRRTKSRRHTQRGVRIERDYRGRIRRIGNVFINYNFRNQVSRIGSIFIDYRYGDLKRIGNMKIIRHPYRHLVKYIGKVKRYRHGHHDDDDDEYGDDDWYDYDDDIFYDDDFYDDYEDYDEDDNYYYYRAKGTPKKGKAKLLKRKKGNWKSLSDKKKDKWKSFKKKSKRKHDD